MVELSQYMFLIQVLSMYTEKRSVPNGNVNAVWLYMCNSAPYFMKLFLLFRCRFGASELHSIASIIGGCAAQEVIKVITHQYVPINNTYIFNGITCTSETYEL